MKLALNLSLTLLATATSLAGCGTAGLSPAGLSRAGAMSAHAAATLDFLTYNTWGKPGILGTDKKPRFEAIGPAIQPYQVVGLQETFTDYTKLVLESAKFPYINRMDKGGFLKLNAGLTTLSKFKFVSTDFVEFKQAGHADRFARKGVMFTRLEVPELGEVDVYNTHYQAQEGYEKIRMYDNGVLADFVKKHDKGNPTFLMGDFNSTPNSPEFQDLMAKMPGLRDSFGEKNPGVPGYTIDPVNTNVPKTDPRQRIDFIFVLPNDRFDIHVDTMELAMNQPVDGRFMSDHFGMHGKFTITPKNP